MAGSFGCRDSHHWCGDSGIKTVSLSVPDLVLTRNITHNGRKFWLQRQPSLMWRFGNKNRFFYQCLTCWPGILQTMAESFGCRDSHHWCGDSGIKTVSLSVPDIVLTRNITHNGRKFWLQRQPSLIRFGNKNRFSISALTLCWSGILPTMAGSFGCRDSHHWCGEFGKKTVSLSVPDLLCWSRI